MAVQARCFAPSDSSEFALSRMQRQSIVNKTENKQNRRATFRQHGHLYYRRSLLVSRRWQATCDESLATAVQVRCFAPSDSSEFALSRILLSQSMSIISTDTSKSI